MNLKLLLRMEWKKMVILIFFLVQVFHILRFLTVEVSSNIAEDLPPSIPYQRPPKLARRESKGEIVEGVPLPR